MKTAIKKIYLVTLLSLSMLSAYAENTSTSTSNSDIPTVVGTYQCKRTDPMNNTITYPLTVSKTNATYAFEWSDSDGDPAFYGTGIIHPNLANVVTTSFWDPQKPDVVGIEVFEIQPDGSLNANWVLQSEKHNGSEVCTKNK